jgi:hypothetical protein
MLSEGISRVRAFTLAIGTAVVKWHSTYSDKLYQVYVNGGFAGATVELTQRQMIVPIPLSQKTAARIEVFAVEPQFADVDFSDELDSRENQTGRVKIEFPRTDNLPMDGKADYYLEENKLNNGNIKIQPDFADKGGFGLSCFGNSDFGFDGSAAIGFGKGDFGLGWFGFDACLLLWQSEQLQAGKYKFDIKITDNLGNTTDGQETETITVIPPAMPAEGLTIKSFDRQNGKLVFQIA